MVSSVSGSGSTAPAQETQSKKAAKEEAQAEREAAKQAKQEEKAAAKAQPAPPAESSKPVQSGTSSPEQVQVRRLVREAEEPAQARGEPLEETAVNDVEASRRAAMWMQEKTQRDSLISELGSAAKAETVVNKVAPVEAESDPSAKTAKASQAYAAQQNAATARPAPEQARYV